MKISAKCKCGLLGKWIEDPDTPFTILEGSATCILALDGETYLVVNYCPVCGGRKLGSTRRGQKCECASVFKWANDPNIPVEYDQELNEYYLVKGVDETTLFYYCPSCGGHLPKSKRASLFTTPSRKEKAEIIERIERIKSATKIDEVLKILGEPDERRGPSIIDPQKKRIYGMRDVKQTLIYTSLAKTLDLIVQEYEDGEIILAYAGKLKGIASTSTEM